MIDHIHPDGEPTPTVRELYEMKNGYAEAVTLDQKMNPTTFRLTEKGAAVLGEIMRGNAKATLARGTARAEGSASMKRIAEQKKEIVKKNGRKSTWTPS